MNVTSGFHAATRATIAAFAVSALLFASCGGKPSEPLDPIVGVWTGDVAGKSIVFAFFPDHTQTVTQKGATRETFVSRTWERKGERLVLASPRTGTQTWRLILTKDSMSLLGGSIPINLRLQSADPGKAPVLAPQITPKPQVLAVADRLLLAEYVSTLARLDGLSQSAASGNQDDAAALAELSATEPAAIKARLDAAAASLKGDALTEFSRLRKMAEEP